MKIGNTTIKVSFAKTDKSSLTILYDALNDLAKQTGNKKDLFYSTEQVQKLKKDATNIFL